MENKTVITGKELIEMGFKSGKWFPEAIEYINGNDLSEEEMTKRKNEWIKPAPKENRGVLAKYAKLVSSASEGAITDKF